MLKIHSTQNKIFFITIIDNVISSSGGGGGITQADLDTKQDFINDGDLSFAKTSGLVAAINSLDKLVKNICR